MSIKVKEATALSFAKFGSVFKIPGNAPTAESAEFKYWSDVASYSIIGETEIGWCTVYRRKEMRISGVERHLRTPEILIPVDAPFILPVLKGGDPDKSLEAFRVNVGEAVVIADGVWHGACLPVGKKESSYFVIFRKGTPHEDVVKKEITPMLLEV
jgi:ureidoglycolate lyase